MAGHGCPGGKSLGRVDRERAAVLRAPAPGFYLFGADSYERSPRLLKRYATHCGVPSLERLTKWAPSHKVKILGARLRGHDGLCHSRARGNPVSWQFCYVVLRVRTLVCQSRVA
jgi:hypothetical protein